MRATVPDEVEFDVPPPAVQLEVALTLAVDRVLAAIQDGQVSVHKGIADRAHHRKPAFKTQFGEIIEKHTADAALFMAVLQVEVFVAPGLEARVFVGA